MVVHGLAGTASGCCAECCGTAWSRGAVPPWVGLHKARAGSRFWDGEGAPLQEPPLQGRCVALPWQLLQVPLGCFCLSAFQQGVCLHLQEAESKKSPHGHSTLSVSPGVQRSCSSLCVQHSAPCLSASNSLFPLPRPRQGNAVKADRPIIEFWLR